LGGCLCRRYLGPGLGQCNQGIVQFLTRNGFRRTELAEAIGPLLVDLEDFFGPLLPEPGLLELGLQIEPFLRPDADVHTPQDLTGPDPFSRGGPGGIRVGP